MTTIDYGVAIGLTSQPTEMNLMYPVVNQSVIAYKRAFSPQLNISAHARAHTRTHARIHTHTRTHMTHTV